MLMIVANIHLFEGILVVRTRMDFESSHLAIDHSGCMHAWAGIIKL